MRSRMTVLGLLLLVPIAAAVAQAQTSRATSAASYLERGVSWMEKGEIDRAIADYDLAIAFDPQSPVVRYNRGVARHSKGDLAGALEDFNEAIKLNPRYLDAYINRGKIHSDLGASEAAVIDFNQAVAINPDDTKAHNNPATQRQRGR